LPPLPDEQAPPLANASCGLIAKLAANAIQSVAPRLIPYIIACGYNAANLLIFSIIVFNISPVSI
jgi:hypothetical protein